MDDGSVVRAQIGRRPRSETDVVVRCHLGLPVVTKVPPILDDGTPFPTLYWLTCPLAVLRISRVESDGGVATAEEMLASDGDIALRHHRAMERYRMQRNLLMPPGHDGPRPDGGVGGSVAGVKCLHAHYADHAAGNDNPIGEWTARWVEPLDCTIPCVSGVEGVVARNPAWSEPRR